MSTTSFCCGPLGEVQRARTLWMTFAEPVADLGERSPVPARLTPDVPGHWRLAGPKTLVFEARKRLPGSTVYQVQALGREWSFSTSPVRLERVWPKGGSVHPLDLFVFAADQAIEPEAVLAGMELHVDGRAVPLLLASDEQIRSVRPAWTRYRRLLPGQRLAVRPQHPLPEESRGVLLVRSGIPSLDGGRHPLRGSGHTLPQKPPGTPGRKPPGGPRKTLARGSGATRSSEGSDQRPWRLLPHGCRSGNWSARCSSTSPLRRRSSRRRARPAASTRLWRASW